MYEKRAKKDYGFEILFVNIEQGISRARGEGTFFVKRKRQTRANISVIDARDKVEIWFYGIFPFFLLINFLEHASRILK